MQKSFYFQHDYTASSDTKILFLRQQLGMEGYGIYWFIIEQLAIAGGKMPLKIIPVLAMQMQATETKVTGVIHHFELFEITDNEFFSNRLNHHLGIREKLASAGKNGALSRWGNGHPNGHPNGQAISHPISHPNGHPNAKERNR